MTAENESGKTIGDFLSGVKETVKTSTTLILERAKEALVERELQERKDAFLSAVGKLQELQRDGYRIKPDLGEAYDAEGKQVGEMRFSKAKLEEMKKNKEAVAKVEKAITHAFDGDFSKLKDAAQAGGK